MNAEKIVDIVKKAEEREYALYDRIEDDYKLFRGEKTPAKEGFDAYTSNFPQLQSKNATNLLARAKLRVYCPMDVEKEDERRDKANAERFNNGALKGFDHLFRRRGERLSLQGLLSWYAVNTGWLLPMPIICRDEKDNTKLDINVWHRRWTRYQLGSDGVVWAAYIRKMQPTQIYAEFKVKEMLEKDGNEAIEVIDWWTDEENAVLIDGRFHKKPTKHGIGFHPLIVIACGYTPYFPSEKTPDSFKDVGESVFSAGRNIYATNNDMMSVVLTQANRFKKPKFKVKSTDGQTVIDEDNAEGGQIPLSVQRQEDIEALVVPELPKDFYNAVSMVNGELQGSGFSQPFAGTNPDRINSALQLNMMQHTSLSDLNPYIMGLEAAYEEIAWSLTRQFSAQENEDNLAYEPLELTFPTETGMAVHKFTPEEVKPFQFKCEIELDFPRDEMQPWLKARIAREGVNPMLSLKRTREEILKIADVDAENDMVLEEWAMSMPTVRLRRVMNAIRQRAVNGDMGAMLEWQNVKEEYELAKATQMMEYAKLMGGMGQMGPQMGATPGQQGAMAPQPPQSPMQGMNMASVAPQKGIQPGFTPMNNPVMGPEQAMNMRLQMAGLVPPR